MATELPTVSEPERAERCETCKWAKPTIMPDGDDSNMLCCRYPPVYDQIYAKWWERKKQYENDSYERAKIVDAACSAACWAFPVVSWEDFCGEWRAK